MAGLRGNRWGREGPPPEAYSRVTEPERFAPLHPTALKIIDQLEETYDVARSEGDGLDEDLERWIDLARPTIQLRPRTCQAAQLTVAFSTFPGLHVRLGKWRTEVFPSCGCDACDETADVEIERLVEVVHSVTRSGFREAEHESRLSLWDKLRLRTLEFRWSRRRGPSRSRYSYAPLTDLGELREVRWPPRYRRVRELEWGPWPLRK